MFKHRGAVRPVHHDLGVDEVICKRSLHIAGVEGDTKIFKILSVELDRRWAEELLL